MGILRSACTLLSISVALFAIFLGLLFSGALVSTGLFTYLDATNVQLRGVAPAFHAKEPWGFTLKEMPDLTGRTALVTGANSGLGYWTALHLAAANAEVILACRSMAKCKEAASQIGESGARGTLHPLVLDLSSLAAVRQFAEQVRGSFTAIDALVLNAAVSSPPFALTVDGLESQIATNHMGHFLLTQELLPLVEAAASDPERGPATVTVVSSSAHYNSYPEGVRLTIQALNDESSYNRLLAYGQSKLANVLFAQELAGRLASRGVLVNSVHPGAVATNLGQHLKTFVRTYMGAAAGDFLESQFKLASWHPREAALTQLYTAVGPTLRASRTTGRYFHPIARENPPDAHAANVTLQHGLWALSEEFVRTH